MLDYLAENWIAIAALVVAALSALINAGFFVRHRRDVKDLIYVEQERDDFRKKLAEAEVRLDHIDPERFIDKAAILYEKAEFAKVEELSFKFAERQQEAFGKAAEYLTEQRILDSETHPQAIEDAKRFVAIGRAAFPDNKRIEGLADLVDRRAVDIERGDPIEVLALHNKSAVELYREAERLFDEGEFSLAEVTSRRSVPKMLIEFGEFSKNYLSSLQANGRYLRALGQYNEAEGIFVQTIELSKRIFGSDHGEYANQLNSLAVVHLHLGQHSSAEKLASEAVAISRNVNGNMHSGTGAMIDVLASVIAKLERNIEAEELHREALKIAGATIGEEHPVYATRLGNLAGVLQAQGRLAEAASMLSNVLKIDRATIGERHPNYATHLSNLASVLHEQGRPDKAGGLYRQAIEISRATIGEEHPMYATRLNNLAAVLRDQGKPDEARPLFEQALSIFKSRLPADHSYIGEVEEELANLPPPQAPKN